MKKTLPLLIALTSTSLFAGFDFNTCSGSGTFEQEIVHYAGDYENAATVGEIPQGIQGLKINLISDKDVDIRIYAENGDKIVHWPHGILNRYKLETKPYQDVNVTYSGYNGTDGEKGHEFIQIEGTTPTAFTMKAFGYRAGYATVNYSWTGKEGCAPTTSGTGTFEQPILNKATNLVGTIPPNVENVEINLTSNNDLDIQLYAQDGTAIARWNPAGLMAGATQQSIIYHDMNITWSGYNGVNNQKGHEYITIEGNTTEMLTMKVYGYQAGVADVVYGWGVDSAVTPVLVDDTFTINLNDIDMYDATDSIYDQYLTVINYVRSLAIKCNDTDGRTGPVGSDYVWNSLLELSAAEHSQDMYDSGVFSHNGSGMQSDITGQTFTPTRASTPFERMHYHNYYYSTAGENIAYIAAYPTLSDNAWLNAIENLVKSHTGHCSNIMSPNFHDFAMVETRGVKPITFSDGVTRDAEVGYWTQNFGTQ